MNHRKVRATSHPGFQPEATQSNTSSVQERESLIQAAQIKSKLRNIP